MTVTEYTWNPLTDSVIEETDGAGNVLATYTNEPSPFGPLISENRAGQTSYYHPDVLGSTRAMTNASQTVTDTATYDAWGNVVAKSGTNATPYSWCGTLGYQTDSLLGSSYVRERAYQPASARWLSIDPLSKSYTISSRDAFALYLYADNQAPKLTDPTGWEPPLNDANTLLNLTPPPENDRFIHFINQGNQDYAFSNFLYAHFPILRPENAYTIPVRPATTPFRQGAVYTDDLTTDQGRLLRMAVTYRQVHLLRQIIDLTNQMRPEVPFFTAGYNNGGPCPFYMDLFDRRVTPLQIELMRNQILLTTTYWEYHNGFNPLVDSHIAITITLPGGNVAYLDAGAAGVLQGNLGGNDNIFFPNDIPYTLQTPEQHLHDIDVNNSIMLCPPGW